MNNPESKVFNKLHSEPVYIVRGSHGQIYDLQPSIGAVKDSMSKLPFSVQRFAKIYIRIGQDLLCLDDLSPAYLAAVLKRDEKRVEIEEMHRKLDHKQGLALQQIQNYNRMGNNVEVQL